jgi:hypothetical protein
LRKDPDKVPYEDWPQLDCIIASIISYGHTFDTITDFFRYQEQRGDEYLIEVSESATALINEILFLPEIDKDYHSPVWFSMKLPEMALSKWKNAMKPTQAKIRRSETRRQKWSQQEADEEGPNQDPSWPSSSSSWQGRPSQDTSWASSSWHRGSWRDQPTQDPSWASGRWHGWNSR